MGLAAPFKLNSEYDDAITEFNIKYDKNKNSLDKLIEFVSEYPDRRINIEFIQGVELSVLKVLTSVHEDIAARLINFAEVSNVLELAENGYQFFFDRTLLPTYDYTNLDFLLSIGVSDVYIADDLCYNLQEVHEFLQEKNVKSRLVLNKIPSTVYDKGRNLRSPIYRPQDLETLSQYYDVFEFDCGSPFDWVKFDVLYRSWFVKEKWVGDLREINDDLEIEFPCLSIVPEFTRYKNNCDKQCIKRVNCPCKKCQQFIEIGQELASKGIRFR